MVVEGDGVVGQTPVLDSGETFSYNSYHVIADEALVKGAFFGITDMGSRIRASIPDFKLDLPDWA